MRAALPRTQRVTAPLATHCSRGSAARLAPCRRLARRCAAGSDAAEDVTGTPGGTDALLTWRHSAALRDGTATVVRPAAPHEAAALTELLADTFATSLDAQRYKTYLSRQVATYVARRLATPPQHALLLVAVADSTADTADPAAAAAACVLLGVLELSLAAHTRSFEDVSLLPPQHAAYVKNVSVAPAHRRRGVAAALLAAAEAYTRAAAAVAPASPPAGRLYAPPLEVFLHVAVDDLSAGALYARAGFAEVARQNPVKALLAGSGPPVALLRKRLSER